ICPPLRIDTACNHPLYASIRTTLFLEAAGLAVQALWDCLGREQPRTRILSAIRQETNIFATYLSKSCARSVPARWAGSNLNLVITKAIDGISKLGFQARPPS